MKNKLAWLVLCTFALSIFPSAAHAANGYQYEYDKNNRLTHLYIDGATTYYGFKYDNNGNLLKVEQLGMITNLTATAGNGTATLQWTAPTMGTVSGYRLYKNGLFETTIPVSTSYTYFLLATGQYTFSVAPIFDSGEGQIATTEPIQVNYTAPSHLGGGGGITTGDPPPAM